MGFFDHEQAAGQGGDQAIFAGFGPADIETLLGQVERLDFRQGEELVRAGDHDTAVYLILAGGVEVWDGEQVTASLSAGTVFGEIAFFDGEPRTAFIRATADGHMARLTREGFERLAQIAPALALRVLLVLGRVVSARMRRVLGAVV